MDKLGFSDQEINNMLRHPEKMLYSVLSLDNSVMQHLDNMDFLKIDFTVPNHSYVEADDILGEVIYTIRKKQIK